MGQGHKTARVTDTVLARPITIVEVGPRDGLQNEAAFVPTPEKIALVNRLADAGHTTIEVSAVGSCAAGDVKRYQLWGRDPSGSICGALFNLSNGLEFTWDA